MDTQSQEQKRIDEALKQLKESTDNSIKELKDLILAMSVKYDQIAAIILHPRVDEVEHSNTHLGHGSQSSNSMQTRFVKMDFPKFHGKDPSGWVYKCERFFEFNQIEELQKIKLAVMHLDEKAIQWYQWFEKSQKDMDWKGFVTGLISRFGPNIFEDAIGELTKLTQVTTVKAYQERFEELANRTNGLTQEFFVSCFLSGLREDIKAGVQMFSPINITQAIGLARLQEESIEAMHRISRIPSKTATTNWEPTSNLSMPRIFYSPMGGIDGRSSPDISMDAKGGYSHVRGKMCQRKNGNFPSTSAGVVSAERKIKIDLRTELEQRPEETPGDIEAVSNLRSKDSLLPTSFGKKSLPFPPKQCKLRKTKFSQGLPLVESFNICFSEVGRSSSQNASLDAKNNANLIEMKHSMKIAGQVLRPGMVLLKSYITLSEQVDIVKKCQKLGIGHGGFYQPGYGDGAKLRLQMMCLGLDWDPQTRTYQNKRAVDGSEPHAIPLEFSSLVKGTIQYSHGLIQKKDGLCNVEDVLPVMSPNICIVNFYTTSGRLGLHQDRDESKESLEKGLPVVSFSIGDSAEFLYGDQRDVEKAEKVLLESGDVLIFGGKSRHIFHGVPFIFPNSAPSDLFEEAKLRPGRLNLTFRQF